MHGKSAEQGLLHIVVSVYGIDAHRGPDPTDGFGIFFRVTKSGIGACENIACHEDDVRLLLIDQADHVLRCTQMRIDAQMQVGDQSDPKLPVGSPFFRNTVLNC